MKQPKENIQVKQLELFESPKSDKTESSESSQENKKTEPFKLYIDGAARGNPGHAGIGIYLISGETELVKNGFFIGIKTNNQAEYLALLVGLLYAKEIKSKADLLIYTDSKLLECQLNGKYKVKNLELIKLHSLAINILKDFNYKIYHIYRESNKQADKLANDGINKQRALPKNISEYLSSKHVL